MNVKGIILSRIGWIYILALIGALGILGKVLYLQLVVGDVWRAEAEKMSQRTTTIPANRGNILDTDGNIIASTVPSYDLAIDPNSTGMKPEVYNAELPGLARGLAELFGDKGAGQYEDIIRKARRRGSQHLYLKRNISYREAQKAKELPLFKHGQFKGGLILDQKNTRLRPYKLLAKRTIGYTQDGVSGKYVGLEGEFDSYLRGEDGMRYEYRLSGNNWIPASSENFIEPRDGYDIQTTLDMNYQDVAEDALLELLKKNKADHGCVVLMEVATGEIKAMVNLGKVSEGVYQEVYNYAVGEKHEPGSTFKLPAIMAALESGKIDLDDTVNTYNGVHKFYGAEVKDSHRGGYGVISVQEVFEKSSNIGMGCIIERCFKDKPKDFIDRIYAMGLKDLTGIEIDGEALPFIKMPGDDGWSKTSLPFMAHGYELSLTPIQILTFYNAVANGGKMVAPRLVKGVNYYSHQKKSFGPRVIKNSICSKETIKKARILLEGVVKNGTAKNLEPKAYQIAGKTGTAVIYQGGGYTNAQGKKEYRASFAGYFPADKPAYSCIVVVTKPQEQYYGNVVAGTVFQDIADKVYATDLRLHPELSSYSLEPVGGNPSVMSGDSEASKIVLESLGLPLEDNENIIDYGNGFVPDVTGMGLSDALPLLENEGLKVNVVGYGRIISQSINPGDQIVPGQTIELRLKLS